MAVNFLFKSIPLGANRKIPLAYVIWFAFALIAVSAELLHQSINNYLIFKNVFWHLLDQKNLYLYYPNEYQDHNLYGPIFSYVIAPFAVLPDWLGVILWVVTNAAVLFLAIRQLPLSHKAITTIYLIAAIDFMTASHNVQFNPMIAGCMILSYTFVHKEKDFWATFFLALGILAKIYGVVGLAFFLFSRHKLKYVASFLFWMLVLFFLPMLISTPAFVVQTYKDWLITLVEKNEHNMIMTDINMQDLSVMGMVRKVSHIPELSNLAVLVPAALLMALPFLRFKLFHNPVLQLQYLALTLITVVIFSSGAESATYIIATVGVGIWYVLNKHQNGPLQTAILLFVLVVTSLSSTDLVPQIIKHNFIRAYALKALPCLIVWGMIVYNLVVKSDLKLYSPELKLEN